VAVEELQLGLEQQAVDIVVEGPRRQQALEQSKMVAGRPWVLAVVGPDKLVLVARLGSVQVQLGLDIEKSRLELGPEQRQSKMAVGLELELGPVESKSVLAAQLELELGPVESKSVAQFGSVLGQPLADKLVAQLGLVLGPVADK
jgi:hypothetical protein